VRSGPAGVYTRAVTVREARDPAAAQPLGWLAGLITWLAVLVPSVVAIDRRPDSGPSEAAFLGAILLFGALFVMLAGPWEPPSVRRAPAAWALAAVASAAAAVMLAPEVGIVSVLFILSIAVVAHVLEPRLAFGVVAFQTLTTGAAAVSANPDLLLAGVQMAAIAGFQIFTVTITVAMLGERRLRQRLSAANAELRATRALLHETSKLTERARISRELHDLVGHHLSALNLHLEVASHLGDGPASVPIARSRTIAKLLLADVRSVVSDLRNSGEVDLRQVIEELVSGLPRPRVHVEIEPSLVLDDLSRAHVIVRCVQEAITNAIRHGDADNVWVSLRRDGDAIDVVARDDGCGSESVAVGNGLHGMRERIDEIGGRLDLRTAPGEGFTVHALIPRVTPAATP
jgi:signal transduction histidine kinase